MTAVASDSGTRCLVSFGPYTGMAGVVTHSGETMVAFVHDWKALRKVKRGTIDGRPCAVIGVLNSGDHLGGIEGMVRLLVAPGQEGE